MSTIPASLRALLSNLVDYAGLFPPAGLPMREAVANYARYLAGPDAWALGRFILPVSRFTEFEAAMAASKVSEPWRISALLGSDAQTDISAINEFNRRNAARVVVDAIEVKVDSAQAIHRISALVPNPIVAYFEVPPESAEKLIPVIHDVEGRAKIRTGGVTPGAIPTSEMVANFFLQCAKHGVAFKATAGLHHPIRCIKPLTYEANAPSATMHGFLNVFLAAAILYAARHPDTLDRRQHTAMKLLNAQSVAMQFTNESVLVQRFEQPNQQQEATPAQTRIPVAYIEFARKNFAISFGSCSFEEPLADLRELKIL